MAKKQKTLPKKHTFFYLFLNSTRYTLIYCILHLNIFYHLGAYFSDF